jgi:hypothetical protein
MTASTRIRRIRRVAVAVAVVGLTATMFEVAETSPAEAEAVAYAQFSTPGTYTWTVPAGVTSVSVDAYGAQGGSGFLELGYGTGGKGALVHTELPVAPGQVLTFVVGGQAKPVVNGKTSLAGGYGGGGAGGYGLGGAAAGGGGATRIELGAKTLLVAGGGGGAAQEGVDGGDSGAPGHSLAGDDNGRGGSAGVPWMVGAGGTGGHAAALDADCHYKREGAVGAAGTGGQGGAGGGVGSPDTAYGPDTNGGGGGGGGYFPGGGGGGGAYCDLGFAPSAAGGGGGGSSYADAGAIGSSVVQGVNSGDGLISIGYLA